MSLQTIVIGVLVLIVLVVMIFIFRDKIGDFSSSVKNCELNGGVCSDSCTADQIELVSRGGWGENCQKCCGDASGFLNSE